MLQRLFLAVLLLASAPFAGAQEFQAGRDYTPIAQPEPAAPGAPIEVVEVFGYPCIHCAHAAPDIARWRKTLPADVEFSFVPAVFGGVWEVYARAYYTAETMGVLERSHDHLFEVLHTERRPINNLEDLARFYAEYGVEPQTFIATLESFPVQTKVAEAHRRVSAWGVEGTPTMIVAGKYRVMSPGGQDGFERMLKVVDYLVAQERAARKAG